MNYALVQSMICACHAQHLDDIYKKIKFDGSQPCNINLWLSSQANVQNSQSGLLQSKEK